MDKFNYYTIIIFVWLIFIISAHSQEKNLAVQKNSTSKSITKNDTSLFVDKSNLHIFKWEKDIKIALECAVKIKKQELLGEKQFSLVFTSADFNSIPLNPVQKRVGSILIKKASLIIPLTQSFFPGSSKVSFLFDANYNILGLLLHSLELNGQQVHVDDVQIKTIEEYYYNELFNNGYAMRILLPEIHNVLIEEGICCPDCPGGIMKPHEKSVQVRDLMNYFDLIFNFSSLTKKNNVELEMLVLSGPVPDIPDLDVDLIIAAFLVFDGNREAFDIIGEIIRKGKKAKVYKKNKKIWSDQEKLDFLKSYTIENTINNKKFLNVIKPKAKNILLKMDFNCIDCEE